MAFAVLVLGLPVRAEGPDDMFIRIYNLIQQADALKDNGRPKEARDKYVEAQAGLDELETKYPNWNEKIIKFRKTYIAEQVAPLGGLPAPVAPGAKSAAPAVAPDPRQQQLDGLSEEIKALRAEREALQAKLREALTAQPAGVDPRELAKVEDRARDLEKENEALKTGALQAQQRLDKMADPAALEAAQKALKDAQQALTRQSESMAALAKDKQALELRMKKASEKNEAKAKREDEKNQQQVQAALNEANSKATQLATELKQAQDQLAAQKARGESLLAEKSALEKRVADLNAQSGPKTAQLTADLKQAQDQLAANKARVESLLAEKTTLEKRVADLSTQPNAKAAQLAAELKRAEDQLAAQKARGEVLLAEKTTLEKRVTELSTRSRADVAVAPAPATPAPTAAPAPVPPPTPASPPEKAPEGKLTKAEKAQIKALVRERDDLRKRVNVLSRQVDDRKVRSRTGQAGQLADEISILRARVEVYEARQVPFAPEELAMLKGSATVSAAPIEPTTKKASREFPAGAAALMTDARRAFDARRFDEAEAKFQEALKLDEKNVVTLTELAAAQLEENRLDAAESTLKRALDQDPTDAQALSLLGLLRLRQEKYDEALDLLGKSSQLDPDNSATQNYLGIVLNHKGMRQPAETALRRAIQLRPDYAEAHSNLAVVYATQKPPFLELARWHYQKAKAMNNFKHPELEKLLGPSAETAPAAGSK